MVVLRPMKLSDYDEMLSLTSINPEQWIYFTSDLSDPNALKKWIESGVEGIQNKSRLAFASLDAKTNQIIGSTSLGSISQRDKRIEIGWTWICPSHQGKGFNGHIKYLMMKYCFEECNVHRVELKTDVLNMPARKAMEKVGLIEEGVLRSHTQVIRNRRRDSIFYSALVNEWPDIKKKFEKS